MQEQQTASTHPKRWHRLVRCCRWVWKHPLPFLWCTLVINVIINLGSTWLITPAKTQYIPTSSPIDNIVRWVGVHWLFSCLILTFSLAILFVSWILSRWPDPVLVLSGKERLPIKDRERILQRLQLRYEQIRTQSLQGAIQINLRYLEKPAAIHNQALLALRLPGQADRLLPPRTTIVGAYQQAPQELLILGEPGAGKSTLLLELALHLVKQAKQDTEQPIPVLLPLSSWAKNFSRLSLQEWIDKEFTRLYEIPQKLGDQCVQEEIIVPLFDGLDEMNEAIRPDCIEAINAYHREHLGPLVVCSRIQEYESAAKRGRLSLNSAVMIQPLSTTQVDAYLADLGESLVGLRNALTHQPLLYEICTTPLMLQILVLTYHDSTVQSLPQQIARLQEQVWIDYVQRMVERKGDIKRYPLEVTTGSLTWLAFHLHKDTVFSLRDVWSNWVPTKQRVFYRWSYGLIFGLLTGLTFGLTAGFIFGLLQGIVAGIVGGLIQGTLGLARADSLMEGILIAPWEKIRKTFVSTLVIIAVSWLFAWLTIGHLGWLAGGVVFGLLSIGIFFLWHWMFSENGEPLQGFKIRDDGTIEITKYRWSFEELSPAIGASLIMGLISGLFVGSIAILYGGLGSELFIALFIIQLVIEQLFLAPFHLRLWLWISRVLPWNAARFLDDATARILLRRVGSNYSFLHALLQEHFAHLYQESSSPPKDAHTVHSPLQS